MTQIPFCDKKMINTYRLQAMITIPVILLLKGALAGAGSVLGAVLIAALASVVKSDESVIALFTFLVGKIAIIGLIGGTALTLLFTNPWLFLGGLIGGGVTGYLGFVVFVLVAFK
ncbi:MAG: hypothetical protein ACRCXZ_05270 [Patescibacteria group bacterium]